VETLSALIVSKFVIVATLSLAAGAVSSGTAGSGTHGSGFSAVLAGGALLLMATFVPFAILRMIPAVEAGAVAHLDGLRQRGTAALTRGMPRTAASHALHEGLGMLGDSKLMAQTAAGGGGGGLAEAAGSAASGGGDVGGGASGGDGEDGDEGSASGIPFAQGDPESQRVYDELVAQGVRPRPKGPKPVLARPGSSSGGAAADAAAPAAGDGSGSGSGATGFEPDPADRVGARLSTGVGSRIGPATAEDAWMWAGVPPGRGLIRSYEPGERRYYMDDNGGPCVRELPRAWPPGQGPDDGAAT
jgi:hypothetical protein